MTSIRLSSRLLASLSFAFYLSTATGLGQQPMPTRFRTAAESMIVVPVTINGAGPFDFLLDTGSTVTIIDRKLAEELHLPPAGRSMLATPDGGAVAPLAHMDSVSMGGGTVRDLNPVVINHYADPLPKVRGLLGEDFLHYFDLFIDNRRHLIKLEPGPGPLGGSLSGEHLPLSDYDLEGNKLTSDRLVVAGQLVQFYEFEDKVAKLQLDSGAQRLLLCSPASRMGISKKSATRSDVVVSVLGSSAAANTRTADLRLGNKLFLNVMVAVPAQNPSSHDVDGFLPTSLFRSIFISHSGRFVILEPQAKPAFAELKNPSNAETEISDGSFLRIQSPAPQ